MVHDNSVTGMRPSRDGSLISIMTSTGQIKVVEHESQRILLSEKKHNLPVSCSIFTTPGDFAAQDRCEPSHIITGSADYTYNIIGISGQSSFITDAISSVFKILGQIALFYCILLYIMQYVDAPSKF